MTPSHTFLYFVGDQKILVIAFFISGWFGQQYDQNFFLILLYKKVNLYMFYIQTKGFGHRSKFTSPHLKYGLCQADVHYM